MIGPEWEFIVTEGGQWVWVRCTTDGSVRRPSMQKFSSYAGAKDDAIKHGLDPVKSYWTVVLGNRTTHCRPGKPPTNTQTGDVPVD